MPANFNIPIDNNASTVGNNINITGIAANIVRPVDTYVARDVVLVAVVALKTNVLLVNKIPSISILR
jgi:hypothetical protein